MRARETELHACRERGVQVQVVVRGDGLVDLREYGREPLRRRRRSGQEAHLAAALLEGAVGGEGVQVHEQPEVAALQPTQPLTIFVDGARVGVAEPIDLLANSAGHRRKLARPEPPPRRTLKGPFDYIDEYTALLRPPLRKGDFRAGVAKREETHKPPVDPIGADLTQNCKHARRGDSHVQICERLLKARAKCSEGVWHKVKVFRRIERMAGELG